VFLDKLQPPLPLQLLQLMMMMMMTMTDHTLTWKSRSICRSAENLVRNAAQT